MTYHDPSCQQFRQRLQQCLDERRGVSSDQSLIAHSRECPSCGRDLRAWYNVESALTQRCVPPIERPSHRFASPRWSVAVATLLIVIAAVYSRTGSSSAIFGDGAVMTELDATIEQNAMISQGVATSLHERSDQRLLAQLDPMIWWQDVRSKDWVGRTMPAVESVHAGVAPLGRTLMRAVTILTTGGTSDASQGQTS